MSTVFSSQSSLEEFFERTNGSSISNGRASTTSFSNRSSPNNSTSGTESCGNSSPSLVDTDKDSERDRLDSESVDETSESGSSQFNANISSYKDTDSSHSGMRFVDDLCENEPQSDHEDRYSSGDSQLTSHATGLSTIDDLQQHKVLVISGPRATRKVSLEGAINLIDPNKSEDHRFGSPTKKVTPGLTTATERGDVSAVKQMIWSGADIHASSKSGRTLLHIACSLGHLQLVGIFIKAGCNVDTPSINGRTPLHEAAICGHYKVIQTLIPEVADLDQVDSMGMTAAHLSALNGEVPSLTQLCNQGCDICLVDHSGRTAVHLAAMNNHPDVIQCLLERGVELDAVDKEGKTPAHYASQYGSIQCLQLLLKHDIDICQADSMGGQPIHDAALNDQLECLKFLLKKGAKSTALDNNGRNIMHKAAKGGALASLHWILNTGKIPPDATDSQGHTGLHYSAVGGHAECYHCLLQHGADSSLSNKQGENSFDVARRHGKARSVSQAIDGDRVCKHCHLELQKKRYDERTRPSPIRMKIAKKNDLFMTTSSLKHLSHSASSDMKHHVLPEMHNRKGSNPKFTLKGFTPQNNHRGSNCQKEPRVIGNLAAKYYGPLT